MNLILEKWTSNDYQSFTNLLQSNIDLEYRQFLKKLLNCDINLLGIRSPILKKIAKDISKGNYSDYIFLNKHETYEEILIHGLIIGYIKTDINNVIRLLDEFIPYINNWAVNDSVAINLKILKKEQDIGYNAIKKYIQSNNPWSIRFGLVLLLDHYVNDTYIDKIIEISSKINRDEYYVKMANAWLLSECYLKYPNKTEELFKSNKLDKWTQNKAIQKIKESYRINKEEKSKLELLKKQ